MTRYWNPTGNIVAQLRNGVTEPVRQRAFGYLRKVDQSLGARVEKGVRAGAPHRKREGRGEGGRRR